jgi:formiminotetrahydrofolate cyclodeaminase
MTSTHSTADSRIDEFLAALGSGKVSPGSGAAGGVALALGAACAAKAVAITLHHHPGDAVLIEKRAKLLALANDALRDADRESRNFADLIHDQDAAAARRVVAVDEELIDLAAATLSIVEELQSLVKPSVAGDLVAARALVEAARRIQSSNLSEIRRD